MSDSTKQLVIATTGAIISTSLGLGPGVGWTAGPAIGQPLLCSTSEQEGKDEEAQSAAVAACGVEASDSTIRAS